MIDGNWLGQNIQVGISIFKILLHVYRPNTLVLGNILGTQIFHNINQYKGAIRVASFLILAIESPIYFTYATYLQERLVKEISTVSICGDKYTAKIYKKHWVSPLFHMIESFFCIRVLRYVRDEEERIEANKGSSLQCTILEMIGTHFTRIPTLIM